MGYRTGNEGRQAGGRCISLQTVDGRQRAAGREHWTMGSGRVVGAGENLLGPVPTSQNAARWRLMKPLRQAAMLMKKQ